MNDAMIDRLIEEAWTALLNNALEVRLYRKKTNYTGDLAHETADETMISEKLMIWAEFGANADYLLARLPAIDDIVVGDEIEIGRERYVINALTQSFLLNGQKCYELVAKRRTDQRRVG